MGPETNTLLGEPSTGVGAQNAQFTIKKKKKYVSEGVMALNSSIIQPANTHLRLYCTHATVESYFELVGQQQHQHLSQLHNSS